jgi:hypothetical protein
MAEHTAPPPELHEAAVLAALAAGPTEGPRGLSPARWALEVGASGGIEMERLKQTLLPPADGPWYVAGGAVSNDSAGPERLSLVVGLWSLGRAGLDAEYAAGAMLSMALLTDGRPDRAAGGVLLAVATAQLTGGAAADDRAVALWTEIAQRWAGATVPGPARATLEAAVRHGGDPSAAEKAARAGGGDPVLAAALVAAARAQGEGGTTDVPAATGVTAAARALVRGASRREG